jgi:UDPglucose 6-dehydrogenase
MIGFIGLSHLGIVSSIAAASKGFAVCAYDPDSGLCEKLAQGEFPVYEPDLADLYGSHRERISFSSDKSGLAACRLIYLSIDIRTDEQNQSDLSVLRDLFANVVDSIPEHCCLVVLSQVPPGFTRQLYTTHRSLIEQRGIRLYYQVETLIFGVAVARALSPERVIVGCIDSGDELPMQYAELLAAFGCPVLKMRYESAELAKISINVCLVATISAANTLAELCEAVGADWYEIIPALKSDKRIGPYAYLTPGLGIGGGNLDRDLATVCQLGDKMGTDTGVIEAFQGNSRHRRDWVLRVLREEVVALIAKPVVAVWGLAYKAGTRSTKDSPALHLIRNIAECEIRYYDPQVVEDIDGGHNTRSDNAIEACQGADVLVVMTPWDEFAGIDLSEVGSRMNRKIIIDPYRIIDDEVSKGLGFKHIRLGESVAAIGTAGIVVAETEQGEKSE